MATRLSDKEEIYWKETVVVLGSERSKLNNQLFTVERRRQAGISGGPHILPLTGVTLSPPAAPGTLLEQLQAPYSITFTDPA